MPVTMLRASYCALKELDVILVTPSQSGPSLASTKGRNSPEARLGVLPQQLGSSVGLTDFSSSLGPQFPCLYYWKVGLDGF